MMTAGSTAKMPEEIFDYGDPLEYNLFWAWEGEKATPPIWDERPHYKNRDLNGTIEIWRNKVVVEDRPFGDLVRKHPHNQNFFVPVSENMVAGGRLFFVPLPSDKDLKTMAELVPRAWIPDRFEPGVTLQTFWVLYKNESPKPLYSSDLRFPPFWDQYLPPDSSVQFAPCQPEDLGCDTSGAKVHDKAAYEKERGSQGWIDQYLRDSRAFKRAYLQRKDGFEWTHSRTVSYDSIKSDIIDTQLEPIVDTTIKPKLKLFIRMADYSDMPQVTNIYNYHIKNNVGTPELDCIRVENMRDRFKSARDAHLPFLVCCAQSGALDQKHDKYRPSVNTVVGMAFADDYCGPRTSLRFTAEVGVFVSPTQPRKGISKCLMDKLLGMLDPDYAQRGGYDADPKLTQDTIRVNSRMLINFMHCSEDGIKEWMVPYLHSWGFEQTGYVQGIGYKLNKW